MPESTYHAVSLRGVTHRYPNASRPALNDVSFDVPVGIIMALLGPNGSGKSTLFKLLSTLVAPQQGIVEILGHDVTRQPDAARASLGVVFQHPSLDHLLTVEENLMLQARLSGLDAATRLERIDDALSRFGLMDRRTERVSRLSGGLQRRVEVAKGMLHRPQLLLLDEPSTGLDPIARRDLMTALRDINQANGTTILLTTHLMDEADACARVALVHRGEMVANDSPEALRSSLGGEALTILADDPAALAPEVAARFGLSPRILGDELRVEVPDAHRMIPPIIEAFPGRIHRVAVGRPSLDDVFVAKTGSAWVADETGEPPPAPARRRR